MDTAVAALRPGPVAPHIVSVRCGASAGSSKFVGSGFLVGPCHVLTARHVWTEACRRGERVYVGLLPEREEPLLVELAAGHPGRDAAVIAIVDWRVPAGFELPALPRSYRPAQGRAVEVAAMSPLHARVSRAVNHVVSSYDNPFDEYELTPEVARGNSGGVLLLDGEPIGLVTVRAENDPLFRALALHTLVAWIDAATGGAPPAADGARGAPAGAPPRVPLSPRGVPGLSHWLGSIHLHVDGDRARDFVEELVARHGREGRDAELAWVVEAANGPQRASMREVYDVHNPGRTDPPELDYFSTTQLHAGPRPPELAQRRAIVSEVLGVLGGLDALGVEDVVVELERVVGTVDDTGRAQLADTLAIRGTQAGLEAVPALALYAPFGARAPHKPGAAAYELHFSLDLPREAGADRPPVALADLGALAARARLEVGGWFLFGDATRWAYRSNAFVSTVSRASLEGRWRALREALDQSGGGVLPRARLRLVAEENLAVWRTPLVLGDERTRTLSALADWERDFPRLREFWVLLPNFLGDQVEKVRLAMLHNLGRGVRYVYFLRSNADARRWLDFRLELERELGAAVDAMRAYVVAFEAESPWSEVLAFIANPNGDDAQGYTLELDPLTRRVLYGVALEPERIRALVDGHMPWIGRPPAIGWHLVQGTQPDRPVTAVCANLLDEIDEATFGRLDSRLALLASRAGGSVEIYGNRSITAVFSGDASWQQAQGFALEALAACRLVDAEGRALVMRFGLVQGTGRPTARASGMIWTGPALRDSRRVLDAAPRRAGVYMRRGAAPAPVLAGETRVEEAADGIVELRRAAPSEAAIAG